MCGRYTLQRVEELADRFGVENVDQDLHPSFNVAPGHIMPVVTRDDKGAKIEMMKWGLIPVWAKDPKIGYKMINARDDTIFDKSTWKRLIFKKRCLVPADGFYEWKKVTEDSKLIKHPYFVHPKQTGLFAFAGLWDSWRNAGGQALSTYSIITTEPNKEMSNIHDRMPVILHQEDESPWLEPSSTDRDDIEPLLRPYEDNGLEMFEVSSEVNVTKNNDERLIYPINSQ